MRPGPSRRAATDPRPLQPLGVPIVPTSIRTGSGRLRELIRNESTVFSGQSGVGKSSLLNAIQPGLGLRSRRGQRRNQKRKAHDPRRPSLLHCDVGGWVVDTPGIRQFELWDVHPEELEGYFVEFRPVPSPGAGFRSALHIEEERLRREIRRVQVLTSITRYESYLRIASGMIRRNVPKPRLATVGSPLGLRSCQL